MGPKERKAHLKFLRQLAGCAERAADGTGKDRELHELRRCIADNEREHRAFGRRLVGNIGARMSVEASVDLFVCRVLAEGITKYRAGKAPIADLDGIREDYVRGAILVSNKAFREAFEARVLESFPVLKVRGALARACEADYAAMVAA